MAYLFETFELSPSSELTLRNSTVSGNKATFNGGGIFNNGASSTMTLINSMVSSINADGSGGGIFNNGGTAILRNTIVAGNTAGSGPDALGNFAASQGHNLIGDTSGSSNWRGSDLLN